VYVISKGRWEQRLTMRSLDKMGVPYRVVVEPQEAEHYANHTPAERLLVLPFSNLGQGSIPARNFVWDHAAAEGHTHHWILDDNIEDFNRLNRNKKPVVRTGAIFRAAEDFVDRYTNIALSGFNYYSLCKASDAVPPFYLNTRIYSCILIRNDIPYRWRGRYNEDTDLSLRVLKDGWCTVLFNAFLAGKVTTQRMSGGNTDELYASTDQRREFAESLVEQHPDVARVVWRFNRWHHHVDYRRFKRNRLIRSAVPIPTEPNEYGMTLKRVPRTYVNPAPQ
jgi:hypothetical protein